VPLTRRYSTAGGTIAVRFAGGRMTLVGVYPAKGYRADPLAVSPQRIDVRFMRHGRSGSEIVLRVVNGHVVRTDGAYDSWTSRGISAVSPPGHRGALRSSRPRPDPPAGHGSAYLLGLTTVRSKHAPRVGAARARRSGKHGTPRHPAVPVDD
jgi:hypothetical protein